MVFQIQKKEEDNFWNKYKSDFFRNSSFNNTSSNGEEEKVNSDKEYKEKQEKTGIYKPKLSIFQSELLNYLYTIRKASSFSSK